jgi:2-polyprenyl-3-methyl-5-hydroxy-6-metoxy-1,4-benzoquinol methylase
MTSISDDRGYNQGFQLVESTRVRMKRRADWIGAELSVTEDSSVLEIGCGTGEIAYWIAEKVPALVLGTDVCAPFITKAQSKYKLPNLQYSDLDIESLNESENTYDAIIGNGILHHLYPTLEESLSKFRKLLKPNGKLVFLEPNYYNPYVYAIFTNRYLRVKAKLEPDEMAFTKPYIKHMLERLQFTDVEVDFKDFLLPGIPKVLIGPSIYIGNFLEKIPFLNMTAQSLFIRSHK